MVVANDTTSRAYVRAARDLVVVVAARASFADDLDAVARRRAGAWGAADDETDEQYWPALAAALAPVSPPATMPMAGLVEAGLTLEGGARGLRGLFTSKPSDKARRRVQKVAALAARVMEVVAGVDDTLTEDERRSIAMAMASFGLTPEELAAARPTGKMAPEQLEVFGELETRVRRELVRGAWQLALQGPASAPARREEDAVRTIAARLDLAAEADVLRAEVEATLTRQGDLCAVAVEYARHPARLLPEAASRAALEHLVRASAPPGRADVARALAASGEPGHPERIALLDRGARVQALALAWTTLVATDPPHSVALRLRAELLAMAARGGADLEAEEAASEVDRFLYRRVLEAMRAESAPASAPPADAATTDRPPDETPTTD